MDKFQGRVNFLCGNDHLKFTVEIWNPDAPKSEKPKNKKVKINQKQAFLYLDVEMYWHEKDLAFKVHRKENQTLNYVSKDSTHTKACFASIIAVVVCRLSLLTTVTKETQDTTINQLCPDHAAAQKRANVVPQNYNYPTLKKSQKEIHIQIKQKISNTTNPSKEYQASETKKKCDKKWTTLFCIGYSKMWGLPISPKIRKLCKQFDMIWLQVSMSYHQFPNLSQNFNSDLNNKVMENVYDKIYEDQKCNCSVTLRK